jgi:hypothetical protein
VRGLIADVNFQSQLDRLTYILESDFWYDLWHGFDLVIESFAALGLHPETADRIVWERCQEEGLILLTGNRNDDGPDSLEATLRTAGPNSLPVVTLGNARRLLEDSTYAERVVSELMDFLDDLESRPEAVLGSGRIFLPRRLNP